MSQALADSHDAILFDLDGVLYAGPYAVPGAAQALEDLKAQGVNCVFVTNNASRSAQAVAEHLVELGIPAEPEEVYGSAPAGVAMMVEEIEPGATVLVTGSDYLKELCHTAGFTLTDSAEDKPQAVIQGFEPSLTFAHLAETAYAVNNGAQWFATNLDYSVPRDRGIAPGNGALVAAVSYATGITPKAAGKPEPTMFLQAAEALGATNPLMVGDRLDTDILGGNRAGFTTALVLTGVDSVQSAQAAEPDYQPTYVLNHLGELLTGTHQEFSA